MTKTELSERSGVSISFLSDLTNGKANPSLNKMESIAAALDVPLCFLLEDSFEASFRKLPPGFERVLAILPSHRAYQVKKWTEATKRKLKQT